MTWRRVGPILWLMALSAYILAGTATVPFHGDESTTLWMSRDFGYTFLDGDLEQVLYQDPPLRSTAQHMRLITGSLVKYAIGISWASNGYVTTDINEQWDWGADWAYNQSSGHAPDDTLLMLGRWPSAIMLALGAWVLFLIAHWIGPPPIAYIASLYYAVNPALLLNGRRAMFEGGLILLSLLTVLAAIHLLRRRSWPMALAVGGVAGAAVAAKHPAAFTVLTVYGAAIWATVEQYRRKSANFKVGALHFGLKLLAMGLIAFALFYLLNPVWWGNPVNRAVQVLDARQSILDGQVALFGGYDSRVDQFAGFLRQVFVAQPQYYESDIWAEYIGGQIRSYEDGSWDGVAVGGSLVGAVVVALIAGVGLFVLLRRQKTPALRVFLCWFLIVVLTSWLLTPLEWQRYYLMAYPIIAVLLGVGLMSIFGAVRRAAHTANAPQVEARR